MGSLSRGLSRGFGAAAEIYKSQYVSNLQQRHSLALEEVKHKYRGEERKQKGIISGQQKKAEIEAAAKEKAAGREHDVSLQTQKSESATDIEHLKGIYGLKKQKLSNEAKKGETYTGSGGRQYDIGTITDLYKIQILDRVSEFDFDTKPVSLKEFARDKKDGLGITDFMQGSDDQAGADAGSSPGVDPGLTEEQKGNVKQGNARGYYLNLKRRFPGDSEKEIRAEVKKRYPSWNG